nr:hypothetical protein [Sporichthya sp.]
MHFVLRTRARMAPGETVLVHGAAGGIGVSALRLAPAFGAARTIVLVSDEAKAAIAREAGETDVVLVDGWAKQGAALTDGGVGRGAVSDRSVRGHAASQLHQDARDQPRHVHLGDPDLLTDL